MIPPRLVLEILSALSTRPVTTIVDGGWGVDALVGKVMREHHDLDLAIDRAQLPEAMATLGQLGFVYDPAASPGPPARVVLKDGAEHEIDLHPLVFDPDGSGWQELEGGAWGLYPAGANNATGMIEGMEVRCLSPELQLRHHLGYAWDQADIHDMRLLQQEFGLRLPPPFHD